MENVKANNDLIIITLMLATTHSKMVALFAKRIAAFSTDNFIRYGLLKN
jgi:hypothetical protein